MSLHQTYGSCARVILDRMKFLVLLMWVNIINLAVNNTIPVNKEYFGIDYFEIILFSVCPYPRFLSIPRLSVDP